MKKLIAVLLSVFLVAGAFAACSNKSEKENNTEHNHIATAATITTDKAKIKDMDALNLIKSYSPEELSLTNQDMHECSFMILSSGAELNGEYYVKVIATVKTEHVDEEGNVSYTLDNRGEYYIRYDGKQVLKKDMTSGEEKFEELEVKEVPSSEE